jgi:hypothetical protein
LGLVLLGTSKLILEESELQVGPSSFWLTSQRGDEYKEMTIDGSTMGSAFQYPSPPNSVKTSSSILPLKPKHSAFEGKIIKTTVVLKQHIF